MSVSRVFQAGDRVRVISIPQVTGCKHPTENRMLQVGDEFVLHEKTGKPGQRPPTERVYYRLDNSQADFVIEPQCLQLVAASTYPPYSPASACKCDIWNKGCTCGAFEKEGGSKAKMSPIC